MALSSREDIRSLPLSGKRCTRQLQDRWRQPSALSGTRRPSVTVLVSLG